MTDVHVLEERVISLLFLLCSKPIEKMRAVDTVYGDVKTSALLLIKLISKHGTGSMAK